MKQSLTVAVLLCIPCLITSSCMFGRAKKQPNELTGELETYCEYGDVTFGVNENYLDESNCLNCTCGDFGMSCCGYGRAAGKMIAEPPCMVKNIGKCGVAIVRIDNENIPCK
ncbi:uncharacterized protein LOC124275133 [Haliotis rubra]|uniref:uncharacterized protein LOC124275133 n=1 Tax=Haliotis rubra TaxID=36100 RepID=UPI001EE58E77|nr:uncharacterized protein LOC124275133 [Haliotis rubra]